MRVRKTSLRTDISFLGLLLLFFLAVFLVLIDNTELARTVVLLSASFVVVLVTYYTNLSAGMTLAIIVDFLYAAYVAVYVLQTGEDVPLTTFLWIPWTPLITWATSSYLGQLKQLQNRNTELTVQAESLATIDQETRLKNIRAFENDAEVYMKISRRYEISLALIAWQFKYPQDVARIFLDEQMTELVRQVSQVIGSCLRAEDVVYLLDTTPYRWGIMLFAKPDSVNVPINRISEKLRTVDLSGSLPVHMDVEFISKYCIYDGSQITPLEFLNLANRGI